MIKSSRRTKAMLDCLRAIENQIAQYFDDGGNIDEIMQEIDMRFGELRDILWHEVSLEAARIMDKEDGLDRPISA
jgi:hypothetical protein